MKLITEYRKKECSMHSYFIQNKPAEQNVFFFV